MKNITIKINESSFIRFRSVIFRCPCIDCPLICRYLVTYIAQSKCHALARFVLFVRLVFEKLISV